MKPTNRAVVLRGAVQQLGERGRGRRYPEEIRARIAEYVRERRAEGVQLLEIARELEVPRYSLRRWAAEMLEPEAPAFVPVAVVGDEPKSFVLHGPRGIRVEGLDVDALAALLVRLG